MDAVPPGHAPETVDSLRRDLEESRRWVQLLEAQVRVLERERQKLSAVVGHGDVGFLVIDASLEVIWSNQYVARYLDRDTILHRLNGTACNRALCRSDATCDRCPVSAAFASGAVAHHELSMVVDGQPRAIYATAIPMLSPTGQVEQTMVMVQDLSDLDVLRRSEQKLRESESRLRMLVEQMPAVIWSIDLELRFTSSVGSALQHLGLKPHQAVGMGLYEYFGTDDPTCVPIAGHLRAMAGESVSYELAWNGRVFDSHLEPLLGPDRAIIGCVGLALDITERKHAEDASRASEARKHAILETALDAIISVDHDNKITEFNPAAETMFGYLRNEAMGRSLAELLVPTERHSRHSGGFGRRIETTAMRKDGSQFPVELAITRVALDGPSSFTGFIRDLTDRKAAEAALRERDEQLRQSQKMEAIGTLAGGVAHDFNNILTAIVGHAGLLQRGSPSEEDVRRAAAIMETAATRGAALTRQLLGFARKGKNKSVPVDLGAIVEEVVGLLQRTLEKNIVIRRAPATPAACVIGDPGQLQQVVLNLAVNARDAMPDGGELTLDVAIVELGEEACQAYAGTHPGKYVRLAVTDTGCGISEDVKARVFEPFFTTKELGKGTGMGLSMAYGIVHNHGGAIGLTSAVGIGTTVEVFLPVALDVAPVETARFPDRTHAGTGRILVVDDEESVREVAADILRELGYIVTTAEDGLAAVSHYGRFAHEIDAILLDFAMPSMDGGECFRALKAMNPDVRAVLCTGYGFHVATQHLLDDGMVAIVPKPYTIEQLSEAIALALGTSDIEEPSSLQLD